MVDLETGGERLNDDSPDKAREILELLQYAKETYPAIAPLVEGRLNHIKRRYAGLIALAVGACELVQVVLR